MATVLIKQSFTLILDDTRRFDYAAGLQEIDDDIAEHWYVKAHSEPVSEGRGAPESAREPEATETRKAGRPRKA
jgi:hypothetical protein